MPTTPADILAVRSHATPFNRAGEPWTPKEDALLHESYQRMGAAAIARRLGRSPRAVINRAHEIGAGGSYREWTEVEDQYLRRHYGPATAIEIAEELDRTELAVRHRIITLGLTQTRGRGWTEQEEAYLRRYHGRMTIAAIAEKLGRTRDSVEVKSQRMRLGKRQPGRIPTAAEEREIVARFGEIPFTDLAKQYRTTVTVITRIAKRHGYRDRPTSRPWTPEDDAMLRELYGAMKRTEVAERLGRTMIAVAVRASQMGLTRDMKRTEQRPWTHREEERLRMLAADYTPVEIAAKLGRSKASVNGKLRMLGIATGTRHTTSALKLRAALAAGAVGGNGDGDGNGNGDGVHMTYPQRIVEMA